jgi:hypothetical protein
VSSIGLSRAAACRPLHRESDAPLLNAVAQDLDVPQIADAEQDHRASMSGDCTGSEMTCECRRHS